MKRLQEIIARMAELRGLIDGLVEVDEAEEGDGLTDDQRTEFDAHLAEWDTLLEERQPLEERQARVERIRTGDDVTRERHDNPERPALTGVTDPVRRDPFELDIASASRGELRDAALEVLEREGRQSYDLPPEAQDKVEKLLRLGRGRYFDGALLAERMLLTENDAYRSAFMKGVTQTSPAFTPEEAEAVNAFRAFELRVMSEGTDTEGGFGVPTLLDSSIILTSGAAGAPVLDIARVEPINTNRWTGVSSAGVSWSFDAEAATVSDDAPTIAQPAVDVHMARGFIPYSIEVGQDYPNFAAEMAGLLNAGYIDLLAEMTVTGSGTAQPWGIFTDLDANSAVEVVTTTDGALGQEDIFAVWNALPERYRGRATWLSHTSVESEVRVFGASAPAALFTVDLTAAGLSVVNGRPYLTTDYAVDYTGTTGDENILVVGDFSNYLVVQRAGMSIELVQHIVDVTNNRPTGERGWFAWARMGGGSINDLGFRLLQNQ